MKAGYVALVGKPNVGKSTLMNALIGQKLSIVSKKPQTTRQSILGILTEKDYQIIFIDTPGLIEPVYKLQEEMMNFAVSAMNEADIISVIVDPIRVEDQLRDIKKKVIPNVKGKPTLCVLNKIDTIDESERNKLEKYCKQIEGIALTLAISASSGYNINVFLESILSYLPEHPPYYPDDILSDRSERFFVSELIREKIFELFFEEVPYSTAVIVREFIEREKGKTYIAVDIVVERDSQKVIIIGKNGEMLKKLGSLARKEIETFLQREIFLEMHVTVRKKWRQNESMLKQFGYVAPKQ
ncbi:MAG: GTPase Era [Bacteroidetes bacterium]|nr:GTPase Era [Bacteroidota bacterium]